MPLKVCQSSISSTNTCKMRTSMSIRTALVATLVSRAVADCSFASIQALLPSIASVDFVFWQAGGSTFSVPNGDIAYPTSPTNLTAHCAVQIRVTNGTSQYGFGMFLPDNWNGRFLYVHRYGSCPWCSLANGHGQGCRKRWLCWWHQLVGYGRSKQADF